MFSVDGILGALPSSMAIFDGGNEVGIGLDFAGQRVGHHLDQIVAGLAHPVCVRQRTDSPTFAEYFSLTSAICLDDVSCRM